MYIFIYLCIYVNVCIYIDGHGWACPKRTMPCFIIVFFERNNEQRSNHLYITMRCAQTADKDDDGLWRHFQWGFGRDCGGWPSSLRARAQSPEPTTQSPALAELSRSLSFCRRCLLPVDWAINHWLGKGRRELQQQQHQILWTLHPSWNSTIFACVYPLDCSGYTIFG